MTDVRSGTDLLVATLSFTLSYFPNLNVMTGLDPVIHRSSCILPLKMDCRVEPGNDEKSDAVMVGFDCQLSKSWAKTARVSAVITVLCP